MPDDQSLSPWAMGTQPEPVYSAARHEGQAWRVSATIFVQGTGKAKGTVRPLHPKTAFLGPTNENVTTHQLYTSSTLLSSKLGYHCYS